MAAPPSLDPPDRGGTNSEEDIVTKNGGRWYFSKKEIEENSPSRRDGIDLKKENYLRMSYSIFIQDMLPILKVPQKVAATAIVICHRFFLRQSHAKYYWKPIATACMFLLEDVICASSEVTHQMDRDSIPIMKPEDESEDQKNLILVISVAEKFVLKTLDYDLQVDHPYKALDDVVREFNVDVSNLTLVATIMANDGLRDTLWLQFRPNQVAICAIVIAGKFLKLELEIDGVKDWWRKFNVTKSLIKDFFDQLIQLYEGQQEQTLKHIEAEGSSRGTQPPPVKASGEDKERAAKNSRINKAKEIRASLLSDKTFVPLMTPKHHDDEVLNRLYDQQKAMRERNSRELAIIEERKKGSQGSFTKINPKTGQSSKKTATVQEHQNEPHNVVENVHTGQGPPHGEDLDKVNKSEVGQSDDANSSDSSPEKPVE